MKLATPAEKVRAELAYNQTRLMRKFDNLIDDHFCGHEFEQIADAFSKVLGPDDDELNRYNKLREKYRQLVDSNDEAIV
jgi:hypothetical protein